MLLPGPEAQQLATYSSWLLNGVAGGLIAGTLFVLPGVVVMLGLSALYVGLGETAVVTGLFLGLAPAVVAIVLQALIRVSRRSLIHLSQVGLAVGAFPGPDGVRGAVPGRCGGRGATGLACLPPETVLDGAAGLHDR